MTKIGLTEINKKIYPNYFTPRQFDVLKLKLLGYTAKEAALELGLQEHTICDRSLEVRQIIGISGDGKFRQKELIQWAIDNGLIEIKF